jgi:hypothetical protein
MDKARKSEQDWPENHAAFGIGLRGDTSPLKGCCGGTFAVPPQDAIPTDI